MRCELPRLTTKQPTNRPTDRPPPSPARLGTRDLICDGFYDVWGDFPEIVEREEFPTIAALRHVQLFEGDPREVRCSGLLLRAGRGGCL